MVETSRATVQQMQEKDSSFILRDLDGVLNIGRWWQGWRRKGQAGRAATFPAVTQIMEWCVYVVFITSLLLSTSV